jgi:hypothetical protein
MSESDGKQITVIDEKLENRRMKIGLKNAIGAIHGAEGADMKDSIVAAGIVRSPGAVPDKGPFVPCDKKDSFSHPHGIRGMRKNIVDLAGPFHHPARNIHTVADRFCFRKIRNITVNVEG